MPALTNLEGSIINIAGTIIELFAAAVIAFHAGWALIAMLHHYNADRPRVIIADGVLAALAFSVAGTLLKALALQSWSEIRMFAFVLALRTVLKQVFKRERALINRRAQN